jgi:hypothetical protein
LILIASSSDGENTIMKPRSLEKYSPLTRLSLIYQQFSETTLPFMMTANDKTKEKSVEPPTYSSIMSRS